MLQTVLMMDEITLKDINFAQQKASEQAIKLNKALGLSYYTVKDGKLYEVTPDGEERFIKIPRFGLRKVEKKCIKLNNAR